MKSQLKQCIRRVAAPRHAVVLLSAMLMSCLFPLHAQDKVMASEATDAPSRTVVDTLVNDVARARPDAADHSIHLEVQYPAAYGYMNARGLFDAGPNSCDAFQVSAYPVNANRESRTPQMLKVAREPRMTESNQVYVCEYLISYLPLDQPIQVNVSIGTARQPSMEAWLGGTDAKPAQGQHREIMEGTPVVVLTPAQPSGSMTFFMRYSGRGLVRITDRAASIPIAAIPTMPNGDSTVVRKIEAASRDAAITRMQADPPICISARKARARNSPAAPSLEAQCLAAGGAL